VIDLCEAKPLRGNFLTKSLRQIRAENKRTQLCLEINLAEEKSQSLQSQNSPWWVQWKYARKERIVTKSY